MANIRKRKNGRYTVEVFLGHDVNGKKLSQSTTFTPDPKKSERQNEKALTAFALEFEKRCKEGLAKADKITFQEYAEKWLTSYGEANLQPTTLSTARHNLNLAFPIIGHLKLSEIKPSVIIDLCDTLAKTEYCYRDGKRKGHYSPYTIRGVKAAVSNVLSAALIDNLITMNPCTVRVRKREEPIENEVGAWTAQQARFFLDAIAEPIPVHIKAHTAKRNGKSVEIAGYEYLPIIVSLKHRCFFTLAIFSGCRRGELCGLTWNNIDFKQNTMTISQARKYVSGLSYTASPKTKRAFRTICLPSEAMDLLRQWKEEQQVQIEMLGTAWEGGPQITGYVFTQETGAIMGVGTETKKFPDLVKAINENLEEEKKLPLIKLHALRHTSASMLIASGLDPVATAARLGHSDPTTTLRIYSHAYHEQDMTAANALAKAMSKK